MSDEHLKITKSDRDGVRYDHPAYGKISVSHITGNRMCLYGSSIKNYSAIALRISRSHLRRDLSHDWSFDGEELIEVWMTPVQWAEAVANMNTTGVPCTIKHVNREGMPEPPFLSKHDQFKEEVRSTTNEARVAAREAVAEVRAMLAKPSISKADVKKLLGRLEGIERGVGSSVEFVERQFAEQVERTVMEAKAEVDSFTTRTILRMGLEKLAECGMGPLAIEYMADEEEGSEA